MITKFFVEIGYFIIYINSTSITIPINIHSKHSPCDMSADMSNFFLTSFVFFEVKYIRQYFYSVMNKPSFI